MEIVVHIVPGTQWTFDKLTEFELLHIINMLCSKMKNL